MKRKLSTVVASAALALTAAPAQAAVYEGKLADARDGGGAHQDLREMKVAYDDRKGHLKVTMTYWERFKSGDRRYYLYWSLRLTRTCGEPGNPVVWSHSSFLENASYGRVSWADGRDVPFYNRVGDSTLTASVRVPRDQPWRHVVAPHTGDGTGPYSDALVPCFELERR